MRSQNWGLPLTLTVALTIYLKSPTQKTLPYTQNLSRIIYYNCVVVLMLCRGKSNDPITLALWIQASVQEVFIDKVLSPSYNVPFATYCPSPITASSVSLSLPSLSTLSLIVSRAGRGREVSTDAVMLWEFPLLHHCYSSTHTARATAESTVRVLFATRSL